MASASSGLLNQASGSIAAPAASQLSGLRRLSALLTDLPLGTL